MLLISGGTSRSRSNIVSIDTQFKTNHVEQSFIFERSYLSRIYDVEDELIDFSTNRCLSSSTLSSTPNISLNLLRMLMLRASTQHYKNLSAGMGLIIYTRLLAVKVHILL